MPAPVTTDLVWQEIERQLFAVLAAATPRGEPRTAGIVYAVRDRQLYVATEREAWKTRHIARNPRVSVTVPIARRVPLLPWIRIPAATVTFQAEATVHEASDLPADILRSLLRGVEIDPDAASRLCVIRMRPVGEFLTYGVGVSVAAMRRPERAQGRAPV